MTTYSDILYHTATDSRGQGHRVVGCLPYAWAIITHPKKEGSIFRHSTATWVRSNSQAEIEAAYWGTRGYDVEILVAQPVTEADYNATHPAPIKIVARMGFGGNRIEDGVDSEATADL